MMPATLARTGVPLVTTAPTTTRRGPFPMPGPPGPWRSLAAAGAVALALAGCSSTPPPPHEVPDEAHGGDRFALQVEASTTSWRLVDEGPGDTCLWHGPTYTVRDGAGVVLDTGPITTDEDDEGTAVGVQRTGGDESCVLTTTVDVPPAGVYAVQVATVAPDRPGGRSLPGTGETFTGDAMLSHEDAATGQAVTVILEGPAPIY